MIIPYLLTPGPLTTSPTVKEAMLRDWGSRDEAFIELNQRVRDRLVALVGGTATHACVPLQGSGTFAIEATVTTLVAGDARLLVLVNGAYGRRMVEVARVAGRQVESIEWAEDEPVDPAALDRRLRDDKGISHVAVVHCETTSGILNPLTEVAAVTARHGRALIVDAMSTFGALPIDVATTPITAVVASSNKCLQGVPGVGFALIERGALAASAGRATSLSLDLYAQWRGFEQNRQWRFTPPTHVVAALDRALEEHAAEGGVAGRGRRYARNHEILVEGMTALGFRCLLQPSVQAPIIVTFLTPADQNFAFDRFYQLLAHEGFLIYPGKLTVADSFRIGCIGDLGEDEMRGALRAIELVLTTMDVASGSPDA